MVPYYTDARREGALTPDGTARICDIVSNITRLGKPHKIGTQLFVQTYPDVIQEVAPTAIVTELFGSYFTAKDVIGSGPYNLFPPLTTVPLFVANGRLPPKQGSDDEKITTTKETKHSDNTRDDENDTKVPIRPYTALHCEPIGNIAVQLSGQKEWTLIRPEYSWRVKPSISADGRAFFASWQSLESLQHVPRYNVITSAGDALWVPTWTWHRVDYMESSDQIAIGASLFHFRPYDFILHNPLFAVLILPAILLELVGYNTQ